jgi:NADH-quinone oxidoreductase subunit M
MGFILLGLAGNVLGVSGVQVNVFPRRSARCSFARRRGLLSDATRNLNDLSGMALSRTMPFFAFAFVIASAASMGIPGFSGFAAEITILIGVWKTFPMAVWITGLGMVLVAAFTLRALKKSFFGDDRYSAVRMQEGRVPVVADWGDSHAVVAPATLAEKLGASLLIFATLAVGLYPQLLLDRIMPAVQTMRFLRP